ncbi:AEC family transporter [bacterium]|nr:AEC family transporter [bacterium]
MTNTLFIINTVSPIFLIVIVGWVLRKIGVIQESFIKQSTKFVFSVTLPVLVFLKLAIVDFGTVFDGKIIILVYSGIFILFFVSWFLAKLFIKRGDGRGVFIQGSFRPNNVIIGLALIMNIFGDEGISITIMILTFLVPLDNILSVIALTLFDKSNKRDKAIVESFKSIIMNPVIIAAVVAIIISLLRIPIPTVLINTGDYLAAITLPLALIGVGGTLKIKYLHKTSLITLGASIIKLIVAPLIATMIGYFIGYTGTNLGIIFILFACPTAIVSFILADTMTPHGEIAGNIVLTTTLASSITIPIGLMILTYLNLI